MSVEVLNYFPYAELATIAVAISFLSKLKIKAEERPDLDPTLLEIHHKHPLYKNGDSSRENLMAVTRSEHAAIHLHEALNQTRNKKFSKSDFRAVRLIVQRMTPEELEEFNKNIN